MDARNPGYAADGSVILEINHPSYGWIPFGARADDCEAHGRDIFARAVAGEFGEVAPYVAPPPPPPPPVVVPQVVTMGQAQLALFDSGYLSAVETALAGMPGTEGERARLEWKTRQSVERSSPLVSAMGAILGLTSTQLDDLFVLAKSL